MCIESSDTEKFYWHCPVTLAPNSTTKITVTTTIIKKEIGKFNQKQLTVNNRYLGFCCEIRNVQFISCCQRLRRVKFDYRYAAGSMLFSRIKKQPTSFNGTQSMCTPLIGLDTKRVSKKQTKKQQFLKTSMILSQIFSFFGQSNKNSKDYAHQSHDFLYLIYVHNFQFIDKRKYVYTVSNLFCEFLRIL